MLINYFKIAWRNLGKSKLHSLINIFGLAIGMSVSILIGLWLYDELSFNTGFKAYDRIARVMQNVSNNGEIQTWNNMPYPLADELRNKYGDHFENVIMCADLREHTLTIDNKIVKVSGGFFEKGISDMLSIQILQGNAGPGDDPSSLLLSSSAAVANFGDDDPINKLIQIDHNPPLKVVGVYQDFAQNSTFADVNFIGTWANFYKVSDGFKYMEDPWRPNWTTIYVQLKEHSDITQVTALIKNAKLNRINPELQKKKPALFLQPMSGWHLYAEYKNGQNVGGAIQYVRMFGMIGLFVLLLACINFMNLSTARSEKRAKEVGIRKTVGSVRGQLILQFFSESFVTVCFAFILAVFIVWISMPFFNSISNKQLHILWSNKFFWLVCIIFIFITSLIAGSYPALYLSSFEPIKVLKGTFQAGRLATLPRKLLVVVQFTVSIALIIGTMIVYRQIQYAKERPVGYSQDGLVNIYLDNNSIHEHFDAIFDELTQTGAVVSMTEAGSPTTAVWGTTSGISWKGKDPNLSTDFGFVNVSFDYGKTINWTISEGRDFSKAYGSDSSALILNEAAVRYMSLEHPIGQTLTWFGSPCTVIGVINDMVMTSPYDEPKPIIYSMLDDQGSLAIIKLNPSSSTKSSLDKIETVFKSFNPDQPFEYRFVNEEYARKFGDEERIGRLTRLFTLLALFISCLGLFGLTSFVAEQRKKEIGVRKVLGASIFGVWNLLSKEFLLLVFISFMIAVPLAIYFMGDWLKSFTYRTELSWLVFTMAGMGAMGITLLTVSFQAIKAAMANPVNSLRTE